MSVLSDLQLQHKIDHLFVDLQTEDKRSDKSFSDWIVQVEKIVNVTQHPKLKLAWAKAEGIIYK